MSVQSIRRGVRLLQILAERRTDLSLREISRLAALPPSTAHRLLLTLAEDCLVTPLPGGCFRLGLEVARLGDAAVTVLRLSPTVHELVRAVCEATQETIGLVQLVDGAAAVIDRVESPHPLRYELGIGSRVPLHCTASGKVLLAFGFGGPLATAIPDPIESRTAATIASRERLSAEIERIRRQGFGFDDEEYVVGLRCVAVPIFAADGRAGHALAASGPTGRFGDARIPLLVDTLRDTALAIERVLGYPTNGRGAPDPSDTLRSAARDS